MAKKDLCSILDFSREEIDEIFSLAATLKKEIKDGIFKPYLEHKVLAMIFEKPSLRTRFTFETGIFQMGGHGIYLSPSDMQLGKRESIHDVAKNLERWADLIMARTFSHSAVEELAEHASIPVINALSDHEHPCQALGDFLTLIEHRGDPRNLHLTFVGDGNNICHSLILLAASVGTAISVACPKGYEPDSAVLNTAKKHAQKSGARIQVLYDPGTAVKDADAIYTDVWASMGQENEQEERKKIFASYQLNRTLTAKAPSDCLIMHCLPAHRGEEITDDVIDSPNSVVFDQAENRLHIQKAIMLVLDRIAKK